MIEEFDPTDPSSLFDDPSDHIVNTVNRVSLSPQEAFIRTAKVFAPMGVGLILIVFGLTSTGSYFTPVGQFRGTLADVFYGWQAGNLIAMVGTILVYDAIKRTGYL
jgi:hypothetical protein